MKKVMSIVLVVCMLFSASAFVFAEELLIAPAPLILAPGAPSVISGAPISRGEAVMLLWEDCDTPYVNYFMQFKDLTEGSKMYEAIRWAKAEKIVNGFTADTFGAENLVTKEQFITMLYRCAKHKGIDVSIGQETNILSYDDAFDISQYAMEAFQWACGAGVSIGIDSGYLYPKACLTKLDVTNMIASMNAAGKPAVGTALAGGWTLSDSAAIPAEAQKAFKKAMEGFTGVAYEPVAYLGSQVVAGLNYAFLCKSKGVYPGAQEYFSIVKVYAALDGSATITNVTKVDLP